MDFTRKARLVAVGRIIETPDSLTYSFVVHCESVRIALLLEELKDMYLLACDIGNIHLNASCWEKIWTTAGTEFGNQKYQKIVGFQGTIPT